MNRRAALVLALVLGLAAAVAAVTPPADGRSGNVRVSCNTRAIDVYFWPHGHPYIKAWKFPAQKAPSLTVYRRGSVKSGAFFFFVSARQFNYANSCDLATNPLPTSWKGGPKTTVTATRRVRCSFPAIVQLKAIPTGRDRGRRLPRPPRRLRERADERPDRGEGLEPHLRQALLQGDAGPRRR